MPTICSADFETRSDIDLRTRGLGPYFASPHWRALILCYSFDGGPVQIWTAGPCPNDLRTHIEAGGTIQAWNAAFERRCFDELARRHGWPRPALEQYVCSMATAAALSLPQSLDKAAQILGTDAQKDDAGKALIKKFSTPRKAKKGEIDGLLWHEPEDHREDFDRFVAYCKADVRAEQAIVAKMLPLRPECQRLYTITERINSRGVRIDVASAKAAQILAEKAKADLDRQMRALTGGEVTTCSQVGRLTAWLAERVPDFDSLAKADILDTLEREDLLAEAREALVLRQTYAKSSVGKLDAMLARADADGRVRGSFVFRSAGTGRYASKGVQWQNMPRERKVFEDAKLNRRDLFAAIRTGEPEFLRLLYGDPLGQPLPLLSDALRGFIWAAPGHELCVADYSGIEGAVGAWLAGEDWKIRALFEIIADPINMPDMYRRSAAGIFGTTTDLLTKKDPRRQIGKVSELALQYGGGCGAFRSMARGYALKLRPMFEPVWEASDGERREKATARHEECVARGDPLTKELTREEWIACELVKVGWRKTHPAFTAAWKACATAARAAVDTPGQQMTALDGKLAFLVRRGFLWMRLPSERCLAFGAPSIREVEVPWSDKTVAPALRERQPTVTVLGQEQGRTIRYPLLPTIIFQNAVQAIALDLLDNGIELAEAARYPLVAHVHDELIAEMPVGTSDVKAFERLICQLPAWAAGLPLTASGDVFKRYRK